jgi:serine/threonine-protein kinase
MAEAVPTAGPALIREELGKLLSSRALAGAPSLTEFLRFIVETTLKGNGGQIKEYVIGVEVFGRGTDFDPRADTIVRVQAVKLRSRLARYYETEGVSDSVRIVLPKGSYVPVFERLPAPVPVRPWRRSRVMIPAVSALVVLAAAGGIYLYRARERHSRIASLAVLPFLNLTGSPQNDYFSDGLTEELLDHLAQIDGLRVPARTSSFQFKNKAADIGDIGRKLNVTAVLEGSVRSHGVRIRVTAQLNRVEDGYHLWSSSFEGDLYDPLRLERDLANAIVTELRRHGVSPLAVPGSSREPRTHEAYNLYLKGRYFWNKRTEQGFHTAIRHFEEAVALDPAYARAWTGLADSYVLLYINGHAAPRDVLPRAEAAIERALALDPSLAEAHATKASVLTARTNQDPADTEIEFQRALNLNAGYASVHQWYSRFLATHQRFEESLREAQLAEELDPVSPVISHARGLTLAAMGRREEAVAAWRRAIELDPGFPPSLELLARSYLRDGACDQAIATQERAVASGELRRRAVLGELMAKCGRKAEATAIFTEVLKASRDQYVSPFYVIGVAIALDNKKVALDEVERGWREQSILARQMRSNSTFDSLRTEPRFRALLKKAEAAATDSR